MMRWNMIDHHWAAVNVDKSLLSCIDILLLPLMVFFLFDDKDDDDDDEGGRIVASISSIIVITESFVCSRVRSLPPPILLLLLLLLLLLSYDFKQIFTKYWRILMKLLILSSLIHIWTFVLTLLPSVVVESSCLLFDRNRLLMKVNITFKFDNFQNYLFSQNMALNQTDVSANVRFKQYFLLYDAY